MLQQDNDVSPTSGGPLYLSDSLLDERIKNVERSSRVVLPGLDVQSYSGYITVNKENDCHLFFWFFPATKVPQDKAPLLVYLNGGPGNSSLIGLFEEIGPLKVDEHGQVGKRQITWTDQFSVIFVDNPVGVGFSYCKPGGEATTNKCVADNLYSFLIQFLQLFPKYQQCDVYLGGISYAGKYVPAFAYKVHTEMNCTDPEVRVHLKGIFIGSGLSDPEMMLPYYPDFLQSLGFINEMTGKEIGQKIAQAIDKHKNLGKHTENVELQAILEICEIMFTDMTKRLGYKELDNVLSTKSYNWKFPAFLNKPNVQEAIHAQPTHYVDKTNTTLSFLAKDFLQGAVDELAFLMDNYKVLIYGGQMDPIVSVSMIEVLLKNIPFSGRDAYLASEKLVWVDEDGNVAGYVTKVHNFTRVVMRNAGHRTAIDQPTWTMDMIHKFIHNGDFHTLTKQ